MNKWGVYMIVQDNMLVEFKNISENDSYIHVNTEITIKLYGQKNTSKNMKK